MATEGRIPELRRAWRTVWWMVIRRRGKPLLTRRTELGIALRTARCGLLTGGKHSWGPLRYGYPGARLRKRDCRWCGASVTPVEEFDRDPPTDAELAEARAMLGKPTEADAARALAQLEREGMYRDGKFLWD